MVPDLLLLNKTQSSIDRRRQGVRYVLLAPLPLAFRRAGVSALTVQAPGCPWTLRVRAVVVAILEKRFRQRAAPQNQIEAQRQRVRFGEAEQGSERNFPRSGKWSGADFATPTNSSLPVGG